MTYTPAEALALLRAADVFFDDEVDPDEPLLAQTLNLNDTWGWAIADGEYVPNEELPRVAELFHRYGWCGILYWASERNNRCRSEFHHINRMLDFVRAEETIRAEIPDVNLRAYAKRQYTIGEEPAP